MAESLSFSPILSVAALAAALRRWRPGDPFAEASPVLSGRSLAPFYRLRPGSVEEEGRAAAQLAGDVAERLRRLRQAYGEWQQFEPGPYFDLTEEQAALLTRVVERASTVHVVVYLDALLPAFQAVQGCAGQNSPQMTPCWQDALTRSWSRLLEVLGTAQRALRQDITLLAYSAADEELARWQRAGGERPAGPWAPLAVKELPSLTLSVDLPLPVFLQSGRRRRLRRTWQRLYSRLPGEQFE
ncbi:MAG: hypothetical protein ACKO4U_15800 [Caldilinea sp.]